MASERLSENALEQLWSIARLELNGDEQRARDIIETRNKAAARFFFLLVSELRERRTADLTADDRQALKWCRECVDEHSDQYHEPARMLAALDKLLARGGKP